MKRLALVILSLTCSLLMGQNLVENPSLENTGPCPVVGTDFEDFAEPWTTYFGTPDYFLPQCAAPGHPTFTVDEQAFDGEAFAGITVYGDSGTAYIREFIHGKLTKPLEAGQHYRITFYVKPLNDDSQGVSYAINNLGMALTEEPMDSVPPENLYPVKPRVVSKNVIANEGFWTAICGVIEARGGEQYFTIGNFNTDFTTQVQPLTGATNPIIAYYLVDYVEVVENDLPQLPKDTIICKDQRIDLRIDGPDVNVLWNGVSSSKGFFINAPGVYTARISTPGCSYTDTIVVEEANCRDCKVYTPNAFTPNDNGRNEEFTIYAEEPVGDDNICEFLTYHINIFDRWGQKVFESNSPLVHWDGTDTDGNRCPQGVYTYTIEYEFPHLRQTQTLLKRGYVTLIR